MCDKVVVCVRRLCVNVCEDAEADAEAERGGAGLKTRTPHNFAGNYHKLPLKTNYGTA